MNSHEAGKRDAIIQTPSCLSCKLSALGWWEMMESSGVCWEVGGARAFILDELHKFILNQKEAAFARVRGGSGDL